MRDGNFNRKGAERIALNLAEIKRRRERERQSVSLLAFVRYFWDVLEPEAEFVDGWALEAMCQHLEAVTSGEIKRLLINVPPGFMKSLLTDVFWPAWEWSAMDRPHLRYVAFSYSVGLTERDNGKFRDLMMSRKFQDLWGDRFTLRKVGESKVTNDKTGYKFASSVGGVGTGERGDRVLIDDPHNIKESESEVVRTETVRWFRESISSRLNNVSESVIIVIMQRVHDADVSGTILEDFPDYHHLMIPMEFESGRRCETDIWSDPREEDGELAWPERFPAVEMEKLERAVGPYAYSSQFQQSPVPRGGGIFKREWWQLYEAVDGKYPPFDLVVASLDGAFTEREENDPSGLTVWGIWTDSDSTAAPGQAPNGVQKVMLIDAWRKHLPMHGPRMDPIAGESVAMHKSRTKKDWGLIEWVAHSCQLRHVDRLLIEAKGPGITAAQEMQRLYGDERWTVQLEQVSGDKVARALSVVPAFSQQLIYAPDREWAEMVIAEMENFPKAKHDDLTDSATQALRHLRAMGLIQHPHERIADDMRRATNRRQPQALYPV